MSKFVYREYRDSSASSTLNGIEGGDKSNSNLASATYPSDPVILEPLQVKVIGNQVEKASKIFRGMVQKEGVIATWKAHQSYEKPSEAKRRAFLVSKQKQFEERMATVRKPKERKVRRRPVQEETDELV